MFAAPTLSRRLCNPISPPPMPKPVVCNLIPLPGFSVFQLISLRGAHFQMRHVRDVSRMFDPQSGKVIRACQRKPIHYFALISDEWLASRILATIYILRLVWASVWERLPKIYTCWSCWIKIFRLSYVGEKVCIWRIWQSNEWMNGSQANCVHIG